VPRAIQAIGSIHRTKFLADYIITMFGFDFRQGQVLGPAVTEQGAGSRTDALRVDRQARELLCTWAIGHRQNPHGAVWHNSSPPLTSSAKTADQQAVLLLHKTLRVVVADAAGEPIEAGAAFREALGIGLSLRPLGIYDCPCDRAARSLCALRDSSPEGGLLFLGRMGSTKAASPCVSRTSSEASSPQAWPSTGDCKRLSIGLRRFSGTMTMSELLDKNELERLKALQLASYVPPYTNAEIQELHRKPLPKAPWWKRLWDKIRGNSFGSRGG
jgi:hypothetical protein